MTRVSREWNALVESLNWRSNKTSFIRIRDISIGIEKTISNNAIKIQPFLRVEKSYTNNRYRNPKIFFSPGFENGREGNDHSDRTKLLVRTLFPPWSRQSSFSSHHPAVTPPRKPFPCTHRAILSIFLDFFPCLFTFDTSIPPQSSIFPFVSPSYSPLHRFYSFFSPAFPSPPVSLSPERPIMSVEVKASVCLSDPTL